MSNENPITLVKELRERTQAGILDCRKALEASNYDIEQAIIWLRENGIVKAAKKGGAIAAEGIIAIGEDDNAAVLFEVNSQTDFVSKNDNFINLIDKLRTILLKNDFETVEQINSLTDENGVSVNELIVEATSIIGEKIVLRRAIKIKKMEDEVLGTYVHDNHQIGAIVVIVGGNTKIARHIAMHVAAMNPDYLDRATVPEKVMEEIEQEIYNSPALNNKPDNIREKMAEGMINKKLSDITLVNQEFIMEKIAVGKYLENHHSKAIAMYRFKVAEGIDKKNDDFATEVAAQMSTNKED